MIADVLLVPVTSAAQLDPGGGGLELVFVDEDGALDSPAARSRSRQSHRARS
jgi:hypothetical protein